MVTRRRPDASDATYLLIRLADPEAGPCWVSFCRRDAGERVAFARRGEIVLVVLCSRSADFAERGTGGHRYRWRETLAAVDTQELPWVRSNDVGPHDLGR